MSVGDGPANRDDQASPAVRILSKTGTNATGDNFSYSSDGLITVAWNSVARDSMFYDPVSRSDSTVTWLQSPAGEKRFRIYHNSSGTRSESYTSLRGVIQSQFSAGNLNTSFYRGYEYDDIGRIKRVLGEGVRRTYSYDNLGRLTSRVTEEACAINGEDPNYGLLTGCGSTAGSESFSFDQVGNRTDLGGVTGTGNRLQSFNGITFSHDADGNVTQKFRSSSEYRDYYWSAEARLDSAYHNSWSKVKYDYDALGRPVRKWRGDPNGWTFDRLFVYDGDQLLVGLDQNMQRIDEYAYAPGIDRPIATIRGATSVEAVGYHVQDELGNIIGIVENGAYVSQTNSYDAWGTPTETGIAYNNRLRWKSLAWEGDVVSLYYMRNRWYDYETGRFMSEDPIGLAGGINMYAFANNDPVNGWDPYGLGECITIHMPEVSVTTTVGNYTYTFVYEAYTKTVCTGGGGRGGSGGGGNPGGEGGELGGGGAVDTSPPASKPIMRAFGECRQELAGFGLAAAETAVFATGAGATAALTWRAAKMYRYANTFYRGSVPQQQARFVGRVYATSAAGFGAATAYGTLGPDAIQQALLTGARELVGTLPPFAFVDAGRSLLGCIRQ